MSYSSEVLADSPLAYWRLGETSGTTLTDASGNSRTGSYVGSPGLGATGLLPSSADKAVNFDGVNDRATVASASWMNVADFTVEAWVNLDTIPTSGVVPIVYRLNYFATPATPGFALNVTSAGKVRGDMQNSTPTSYTATGATTLTTGTTYHLVMVWDGQADVLSVYVNGVLDGSTGGSGDPGATTEPLHIGARASNTAGTTFNYADGRIDEVALYGTALSATRIKAHYDAGVAAATSVNVAGSTANVAVAGLVGAAIAPARILGATANVAVAAHPGAIAGGGAPVAVPGSVAGISVTAQAGSPIAGAVTVETSTRYANDGYNYDGMAAVDYEDAIAEPPAHIRRSKVMQVHQSMSAPVLVNGRPT